MKEDKALEAGADIVLMPQDPKKLNIKIQHIIKDEIHPLHKQIEHSIKKVIRYKFCMGLINVE